MARETRVIHEVNKLLESDKERIIPYLTLYVNDSFRSSGRCLSEQKGEVINYDVSYEHKWLVGLPMCEADAKRQMIYATVKYPECIVATYRLSARNFKKYVKSLNIEKL